MEGVFAPYGADVRKRWGDPWTLGTGGFYGEAVFGDAVYGNQYYCGLAETFGIFKKKNYYGKPYLSWEAFYPYVITHTINQQANRNKFKAAKNAWNVLTDEEKAVYNESAKGKLFYGYNIFIKEYMLS